MLRKLFTHRLHRPMTIECRRLSSDLGAIVSMIAPHTYKFEKPSKELCAIQDGSSRYWELANSRSKYVCIGGTGPCVLPDKIKISHLIDFKNKEYNKLHIEFLDCPTILATKIMSAFPRMDFRRENLRIIKLSYHKYTDQNKGQFDCLIVTNHICALLNEGGDFGFYSGSATKNANNELLFHNHKFMKTTNDEIHATVTKHHSGLININNLTPNDVGVIYTDSEFSMSELRRWIEETDLE